MSSSLLLTPMFFKNTDSDKIFQKKRLSCFTSFCSNSNNDRKRWSIGPKITEKDRPSPELYVPPHRRNNCKTSLTFESIDSDVNRLKITDEQAAKLIGPYGREITKIRNKLKQFATLTTVNINNWKGGEDRIVTVMSSSKCDRKRAIEMITNRIND